MLRALAASFIFSLSLLLAACGDDAAPPAGSVAPTPMPASVSGSGNVVKGLIRNGIVSAWRWQDGAYVQVATGRTGPTGDFLLEIPAPVAGEVLRLQLDVSPDTSPELRTEMLCDVAQCGSGVRGEWVPLDSGLGLRSWASVGADGVVTLMPLSPVSTLLVSHAESLNDGRLTTAGVDVASLRVAALFGLAPEQLLSRPGNLLDPLWLELASPEALRLSVLSAAVAELSSINGVGIEQVLAILLERFNAHDGHLMQAGEVGSLADIYQGVASLTAANPALQDKVGPWVVAAIAGLQPNELNTSACGEACVEFDSNDVITALGTGSDSLGGDLRRLMEEQGVTRIEDLIAAQLAHYGWLAPADLLALAAVAREAALVSALSAAGMGEPVVDGLAIVREGDVLHFDGQYNGFAIDLDITVPPLPTQFLSYVPGSTLTFVIGAKGTVENGSIRARLDGNLTIRADGTDFMPLRSALEAVMAADPTADEEAKATARTALFTAVAGIVRSGSGLFTLAGEAALVRLEPNGSGLAETDRLAISGRGQMQLDMDGAADGGITASGRADRGTLTLPNGDTFTLDPGLGHALTFALGVDGSASIRIGADVLGHAATVSGSGEIANLGTLLGHLRDNVATLLPALAQVATTELAPSPLLTQLVEDLRALELTVTGQAEIPSYGHTYSLSIANGVLAISQPDSSAVALQVELLSSGMVARAGEQWWLVGLDLGTSPLPSLTLADSRGGEWRWSIDLAGVLASL